MKNKLLSILIIIFSACALSFTLTACGHTHDYKTLKSNDLTHWVECECGDKQNVEDHEFINYVSDNNATYESDGTKTATCERNGCGVKHTIVDTGSMLDSYVSFKTLSVDNNTVYGVVSNDTETFSFIDEVEVKGKSKYIVSLDEYGVQTVATKIIPLNAGDNKVYIIELIDDEVKNVYNVTIRRKPIYTVSFSTSGSSIESQRVEEGYLATTPTPPTRTGYTFNSWIYNDGGEEVEWNFSDYSITNDITFTAKWDYITYELPIINIDTQGASINSKVDYTDMTFSLENCDDELLEITGGIRLRGNTTKGYPKKPYRIKFDKKQSLFGLKKAKSWVLLADYLDPSALHNYTAFTLANEMLGLDFTPSPYKVNVYLNGNFVGLYTLCEQVQEDEGRIDIELDEITEDMVELKDFNFFICMDKSVKDDSDSVLDETYFYLEEYDRYFELKYPEKDQFVSEKQFELFFAQLKEYVSNIMFAFENQDVETIKKEVNINSLIDYLIVDQIMGEQDHAWKSFNMYYTHASKKDEENGKLNFGPIWDYDWALYTPWTGKPNQVYDFSSQISYSNVFFRAMADIPEFYEIIKERYSLYASNALGNYIEQIDDIVESMAESIQLNEDLWYSEFEEDLSKNNIDFLIAWLKYRKELLDEKWHLTNE